MTQIKKMRLIRRVLLEARKHIVKGEVLFVCYAINKAYINNNKISDKARDVALAYIRQLLGKEVSVIGWLLENHREIYDEIDESDNNSYTLNARRAYRLAWIDHMVSKLDGWIEEDKRAQS